MEKNMQKTVEVLNDLIKINNARIAAYQVAGSYLKSGDADLKNIFSDNIKKSRSFIVKLETELSEYGGAATAGQVRNTSIDTPSSFAGGNREKIVGYCEQEEKKVREVYDDALEETGIPPTTVSLILVQRFELRDAGAFLKDLRSESSFSPA